jgi:hypothetical protein
MSEKEVALIFSFKGTLLSDKLLYDIELVTAFPSRTELTEMFSLKCLFPVDFEFWRNINRRGLSLPEW